MIRHYTEDFKKQILKKLLHPSSRGIKFLSEELGIPASTISTWKRRLQVDQRPPEEKLPKDWDHKEKFNAVLEASSLKDEELGMWLRKKGLHSEYLELWKQEIIDMNQYNQQTEALKQAKKRIKELEIDLRKKEKALAEASALLILKKKTHLIWEAEEH